MLRIALTLGVGLVVGASGCATHKPKPEPRADRIAVAISGGGYRATLMGLGTLEVLNELGLDKHIVAFSGVSGGAVPVAAVAASMTNPKTKRDDVWQRVQQLVTDRELARTSVLVELHEAGAAVAGKLGECVVGQATALFDQVFGDDDEPTAAPDEGCFEFAFDAVDSASMAEASAAFAAGSCNDAWKLSENDWMQRCRAESPAALSATTAMFVSETVAWEDHTAEVVDTFCAARRARCLRPDARKQRHPFADLLDSLLLEPLAGGLSLRMGELPPEPLIALGSTETGQGHLWVSSNRGAGLLAARADTDVPAKFTAYADGKGPPLAESLAASACYPLFCRPIKMPTPDGSWLPLTDGGVHDNLGILPLERMRDAGLVDYDILIVVDARARTLGAPVERSRLGTMLRIHDLMLAQRSDTTLAEAQEDARAAKRCQPLHIAAPDLPNDNRLATLPTDLWPLRDEVGPMLDGVRALARTTLEADPCLRALRRTPGS